MIAVPHEKWQERPLACVLARDGIEEGPTSRRRLLEHLAERFPDWWLPDEVVFVEEIPRTSTGKFDKMALRERFADAERDRESDAEARTD